MLLSRDELQERLLALHRASLDLVKDISLVTLLEKIASLACEQVEAKYAALGVLDDDGKLKQFITVGMSTDEIKQMPHPPRGTGLIGALMQQDSTTIRIPEIESDPRAVGFPAGHPEMHALLGVPIRIGGRQLGQIYLTDKVGDSEFNADDEKIIEILASYAGVAIANARLYEQLQERETALRTRNDQLSLLNQIGAALSSSLELEDILKKTLALLMAHFQVEAGEIFLMEEDDQTLKLVLHRGEAAEAFWKRNRFKVGEGMVGKAALTLEPIISQQLEDEKEETRQAVVEAGFKQIVCIPLTAHGDAVGVLTFVTRSRKQLSDEEIKMVQSVASGAGTAIENARLHSNVRRLAVLEERERIGMDLHDGTIQSIYGVGLSLENARSYINEDPKRAEECLKKAEQDLNNSIRDIRSYILDLRPRNLHGESLIEGLGRLVSEFRQNTGIDVSLAAPKESFSDMSQMHAISLFHICQEALANIAKHAKANRVSVDLWATTERVLLEVTDNGQGFDVEKTNRTVGHGLANMQTRVQNSGGEVEISSAPGEGTSILAWVPRISSLTEE
jgi:two-component system sensor histidine kinase DevS